MIYSTSSAAKREELLNSIAKGARWRRSTVGAWEVLIKDEKVSQKQAKKLEITRTAERLWRINIKFLKLC